MNEERHLEVISILKGNTSTCNSPEILLFLGGRGWGGGGEEGVVDISLY